MDTFVWPSHGQCSSDITATSAGCGFVSTVAPSLTKETAFSISRRMHSFNIAFIIINYSIDLTTFSAR